MTDEDPPPPDPDGRRPWRLGDDALELRQTWPRPPKPLPPGIVWTVAVLFTATAATGLTLAAIQLQVGSCWVGTGLFAGILSAVLAMFQLLVSGYHRRYR